MEDKLQLLFAAVHKLASDSGDSELVQYLEHPSHHSVAFNDEITKHSSRISDVDGFVKQHDEETHPGGASRKTYSEDELKAFVAQSVKDALKAAKQEGGKS